MADNASLRYAPLDRTPPGDSLAETLEALGMTQAELADRIGLHRKTVNQIIQGVAPITAETALKLETVLGTPASFWISLDGNYQEFLARKAEREHFETELAWLKRIPVKEMQEKRWLPASADLAVTLNAALSFFGVASTDLWESRWSCFSVAYRKSRVSSTELGIAASWLRKGELDGQATQTQPFHADKFRAALDAIRPLTLTDPTVFQPRMKQLCAAAGVALVFTPELKKLRVSGATHWLTPEKALIQLSLRFKSDDHLWFTFFHESCHVLQALKKGMFIEGLETDGGHEDAADAFSSNFLIPKAEHAAFLHHQDFTEPAVRNFAKKLAIAPGIVVGRLQHDETIGFEKLNHLKRRFVWAPQP